MSARLAISTDEGLILETSLAGPPVRIGRAKDNSLRSEDRRTSRHHAVVRRLPDDTFEVEDVNSSYGTLLNGRSIVKEPLKHQDILRCGGLTIQFLSNPVVSESGADESADPSIMTATLDNLFEARQQIRRLIDEQALLRKEVGIAQEAEDRAKRLRDEAQDEVEALHKVIDELRKEKSILEGRLEDLGRELREKLSTKSEAPPDIEALKTQFADSQKQSDRHKHRAVELESREAERLLNEQNLRKEVERLSEQIKQREQREVQLTQAVKPALLRIAELTHELEQTQIKLIKSEAALADLEKERNS